MTDTTETKPARAWYTKKRYWIPAALLALFVWIGVSGDPAAETPVPAAPAAAPERDSSDVCGEHSDAYDAEACVEQMNARAGEANPEPEPEPEPLVEEEP
jgi:hypothetical protein